MVEEALFMRHSNMDPPRGKQVNNLQIHPHKGATSSNKRNALMWGNLKIIVLGENEQKMSIQTLYPLSHQGSPYYIKFLKFKLTLVTESKLVVASEWK